MRNFEHLGGEKAGSRCYHHTELLLQRKKVGVEGVIDGNMCMQASRFGGVRSSVPECASSGSLAFSMREVLRAGVRLASQCMRQPRHIRQVGLLCKHPSPTLTLSDY